MKKERTLREKTLLTLCQNRKSSFKFTRISLFIKAYSYFFKSKWGFSFKLVRDQANGLRIKSSTFNFETSKHDSRSSFIAPSDHNVSWRSNQRNLLYSFIVKIYTEDCTYIQIKYKLIICYTISWLCDLSFTKIVCTTLTNCLWSRAVAAKIQEEFLMHFQTNFSPPDRRFRYGTISISITISLCILKNSLYFFSLLHRFFSTRKSIEAMYVILWLFIHTL